MGRRGLPQIDVPTLVIGGGKDLLTPQRLSYEMRDLIPDARLILIDEATHAGLLEHPDRISNELIAFINESRNER